MAVLRIQAWVLMPARTKVFGRKHRERSVKVGAEEGTVALLDDDFLQRMTLEFRQQLTPVGPGNGDTHVVPSHVEKGIAQVGSKLLAHPDDRLLILPEGCGEPIHPRRNLVSLRCQGGLLTEIVVQPNIVFVLMDNLGYGELGCYGGGILRGAPTPRIDKLALTNPERNNGRKFNMA
jgi:hypothetical protein